FTTRDTAPLHNRYQYADTNPITNTDPTGQTAVNDTVRSGVMIGIAVIAAIVTVALTAASGGIALGIALAGAAVDTVSATVQSVALMTGQNQWDSPLSLASYALAGLGIGLGIPALISKGIGQAAGKSISKIPGVASRVGKTAGTPPREVASRLFKLAGEKEFDEGWNALRDLPAELGAVPVIKVEPGSAKGIVIEQGAKDKVKYEHLPPPFQRVFDDILDAQIVGRNAGLGQTRIMNMPEKDELQAPLWRVRDEKTGLTAGSLWALGETAESVQVSGYRILTGQMGTREQPMRRVLLKKNGVVVGDNMVLRRDN
ncbi:hypothetical protein ACFVRE_43615, partial [Streptomyces sp. NPDC057910]